MNKFKVCMVGDFSVGKTSLTQKFVKNIFSDKYLTTVGVKIDTTIVDDTKLVIWDVAGRDSLSPLNVNYLVGASSIIIVCDGTRLETLSSVPTLLNTVFDRIGKVPVVVAINKFDHSDWMLNKDGDNEVLKELESLSLNYLFTSAKTGGNVSEMFEILVKNLNK